jgi:hypothetical protein
VTFTLNRARKLKWIIHDRASKARIQLCERLSEIISTTNSDCEEHNFQVSKKRQRNVNFVWLTKDHFFQRTVCCSISRDQQQCETQKTKKQVRAWLSCKECSSPIPGDFDAFFA